MKSTTIVIFGASGDLTARKLVPALYNNYRKGRLPENTSIIGFSRSPFSDDAFRTKMQESIKSFMPTEYDERSWNAFARSLYYRSGDMARVDDYHALGRTMNELGDSEGNHMYYLATAPNFYPIAIANLGEANMVKESARTGFRRIIIEKPFGHDLASALELNQQVHKVVHEKQVYRIDHYLGKETVQNLLVFRFGNAIFEPLWNRNYVDHVQITVAETVSVGHRADYYEKAGVLRDMFQNHILQLLTLVAMEPPAIYEADELRNEKVKVLTALREIPPESVAQHTVRAQYQGYKSERGVDPHSQTATYAAVQLFVDNWRWQGVPFYLRSGKCMKEKTSEIMIQFRRPPTQLFDVLSGITELYTNRLSVSIQPDEGLHLRFIAKVPDKGMQTRPVDMDFNFSKSFAKDAIPEAYERLLLDALHGDASLFARSDEIELAWKLIDSIQSGWVSEDAPPLLSYAPNSWGPAGADELLARDGRWWVQGAHSDLETGTR